MFQAKNKTGAAGADGAKDAPQLGANIRAGTPPMQSLGKSKMNITIGKGEIEQKKGQTLQSINIGGDNKLSKDGKQVDTLHQLFLNHLLRPKEWSASVDGQTYFAFRREHILALAEEA